MPFVDQRVMWSLYRRTACLWDELRDGEFVGPMLFDDAADITRRYDAVRRELLLFGIVAPACADPWPDPRGWLSDRTMEASLQGALRRMEAMLAPPGMPGLAPYGVLCC